MWRSESPALPVAVCVLLGSALASWTVWLPLPGCLLLVCLGSSLGRRWSLWLALTAAAALNGELARGAGVAGAGMPIPSRPVTAELELRGGWREVEVDSRRVGWSASARVRYWRQGTQVHHAPQRIWLFVGGPEDPPGGRRLRARGYLGRHDGFVNFALPEPGPWRLSVGSRRLLVGEGEPGGPAVREAAEPPRSPGRGLQRALVRGDRRGLPESWQAGLRRWGLAHLLAVSGLHVGLLMVPAVRLGRHLPRAMEGLPALLLLALYLELVGPRPSLLRAVLMVLLLLVGHQLCRPPVLLNALSCVAVTLLAHDPLLVEDLGFRLTFAATAGILLLGPLFARRWTALPSGLARLLAGSVGAQLGALPFALPAFSLLSPFAPVVNLVAVPWTGLCLTVAFVCTLLERLDVALAGPGLALLDRLAAPFGWPASLPPRGPAVLAGLPVDVGPWSALLLSGTLTLILCWPRRLLLPALMVLVAALALRQSEAERPGGAEVVMLDVGQGDALLLRSGSAAVLVDGGGFRGGGDFAGRVLLPALRRLGLSSLDSMIMTHPDLDHCGGLVGLSRYLPVEELWLAPGWPAEGCVGELRSAFTGRVRRLERGDRLTAGGWRFFVLHPPAGGASRSGARLRGGPSNAGSLVISARFELWRVLLTGDIDARVERLLLRSDRQRLPSQVLKVAHHGSGSSTTPAFLEAVKPRWALLSVGRGNAYGHPDPEVLERLGKRRVVTLRTDLRGAVRLMLRPGGPLSVEEGSGRVRRGGVRGSVSPLDSGS